jgi:hypothetical protein
MTEYFGMGEKTLKQLREELDCARMSYLIAQFQYACVVRAVKARLDSTKRLPMLLRRQAE